MEIQVSGRPFSIEGVNKQTLTRWGSKIEGMPQIKSGAVSLEAALDWTEKTFRIMRSCNPAEAVSAVDFHLTRSYGFGGSDMGILLAHENEEFHPFNNLSGLIDEKSLKTLPMPPTIELKRGKILEDLCAVMFVEKFDAKPNHEAQQAIMKHNGSKEHPWQVGNPDHCLIIAGQKITVDYKVPADGGVDIPDVLMMQYSAQVNHYEAIGEEVGHPADALTLASLDIDPNMANTFVTIIEQAQASGSTAETDAIYALGAALAKKDLPGFRIVTHGVRKDKALQHELVRIGDSAWEHVLNGTKPSFKKRDSVQMNESDFDEAHNLSRELAVCTKVCAAAEDRQQAVRKKLADLTMEGRIVKKGMRLPSELIGMVFRKKFDTDSAVKAVLGVGVPENSIRSERVLDADLLAQKVIELGGDPEECTVPGDYDKSAVKTALDANGLISEGFTQTTVTMNLTRTKTKPAPLAALEHLGEFACDAIDGLIDDLKKLEVINDMDLVNKGSLKGGYSSSLKSAGPR